MTTRAAKVWCVKYTGGWCAVKGNHEPAEGSMAVPTACDHYVIVPHGYAKRRPTCKGCRAVPPPREARRATKGRKA